MRSFQANLGIVNISLTGVVDIDRLTTLHLKCPHFRSTGQNLNNLKVRTPSSQFSLVKNWSSPWCLKTHYGYHCRAFSPQKECPLIVTWVTQSDFPSTGPF